MTWIQRCSSHWNSTYSVPSPPLSLQFLFFCFFVFVFVCLCLRQKQLWVRVFDCGITIPSLHWMTCISTGGGLYDFPLSTGEDFTKIPPLILRVSYLQGLLYFLQGTPPPTHRGCIFPFILLALRAFLLSPPNHCLHQIMIHFCPPLILSHPDPAFVS